MYSNALISAPFNIVAYAFFFFFEVVSVLVVVCSAGRLIFNISALVPVNINYNKKKKKSEYRVSKIKKIWQRTGTFFRSCIQKTREVEEDLEVKEDYLKVYLNYADTGRVYCRYCRCQFTQDGDISNYFDLFVNYRLDEDDVKLMKRLMHGTGLCPHCYRPYKIFPDDSTDRLNRPEIQLEIIRYLG